MDEYIDREALLQRVNKKTSRKFFNRNVSEHAVSWATYMINTAPSAEVAPVVLCGNCAVPHNQWTGCPMLNGLVTPPDFYCKFGEKKGSVNNA